MIVALHGRPGSGKTHIAKQLEKYGFVRLSFAEPLKQIGMILGFTEKEMYDDKTCVNKLWGITGREFLRKFGTEIGQDSINQHLPKMRNLWTRLLEKKMIALIAQHKNVVIDDLRFSWEFDMLRKYISYNIYVRAYGTLHSNHLSDKIYPHLCCMTIVNKKDDISYATMILDNIVELILQRDSE